MRGADKRRLLQHASRHTLEREVVWDSRPFTKLCAGRTNSLGADFSEIWRHSQFPWIDGMEAAFRSDADFVSTMQFTCGVVNIGFAPCRDRAPFYGGVRKVFRI